MQRGWADHELRNYDQAISYFDKTLLDYPNFSDAKYYKGLSFLEKGDTSNAELFMRASKVDFERGYSINEDDSFYVDYPYKVNWYLAKWLIPNYKE